MSLTLRRGDTHSAVHGFAERGVYGDELGPFATFAGQAVIFLGIIFAFPPVDWLPAKLAYVILLGAIGVFLLAPRNAVKLLPVSLSVLAFVGVMLLSVLWTNNPAGTAFRLERNVPLVLAFATVMGLLKFEDLMKATIWAIRLALLTTLLAVTIDPSTHAHFGPQFGDQPLPGWHGWYNHKNAMAPFFSFAALTVMMFDRNQLTKWLTTLGLTFMVIMSQSFTGIFALIIVFCVWWWLTQFARFDDRSGVTFFASTFGLGALAIIGGVVSTSTSVLTSVAGKDTSLSGRTDIWGASITAFMERPLLGYGVNGLFWGDPATPELLRTWRQIGFEAQHPHQGLLAIAIDLGILGVIIFVGMFYSTFRSGWKMIRTNRQVGFWIVAVMVGQIFMSLSENTLTGRWLLLLVIFRLVTLRRHGMEFAERAAPAKRSWATRTPV